MKLAINTLILAMIVIIFMIGCEQDDYDPYSVLDLPPQTHCPGIDSVKFEGYIYPTILIGNQCWLAKNLNSGNQILDSEETTNNGIVEKYCYDNDTANCSFYGGLYTWDEMMNYSSTKNSRGICPEGWHIPTQNDFVSLLGYLDNNTKYIKVWGYSVFLDEMNLSGFTALPGGYLQCDPRQFKYMAISGHFWSSDSDNDFGLENSLNLKWNLHQNYIDKKRAVSVRCIKD